jgi:hypothetical protein
MKNIPRSKSCFTVSLSGEGGGTKHGINAIMKCLLQNCVNFFVAEKFLCSHWPGLTYLHT